jgi:N-acetylmuramoyl-L-alanine amidase
MRLNRGLATVLLAVAVAALPPERGEAAAGRRSCNPSTFLVVLDVGHSQDKPGARSARGVGEYDFNLALAKLIEKKLREAGFGRTALLVTPDPPPLGLVKRAAHANRLQAGLFLSIHHDSVPNAFLEKWEFLEEPHSFSDRFKGHSIFVSHDNHDYKGSLLFGNLLGKELKARGLQYTPHYVEEFMGRRRRVLVDAEAGVYRYDQLIVLRSTQMPAVLLEAGSIINRDEELVMASFDRRLLISEAVTQAVESFCTARSRRPAVAGRPGRRP